MLVPARRKLLPFWPLRHNDAQIRGMLNENSLAISHTALEVASDVTVAHLKENPRAFTAAVSGHWFSSATADDGCMD